MNHFLSLTHVTDSLSRNQGAYEVSYEFRLQIYGDTSFSTTVDISSGIDFGINLISEQIEKNIDVHLFSILLPAFCSSVLSLCP